MIEQATSAAVWPEGDYWTLQSEGREVRLKDSRGLRQLAELISHPGAELHVLDLAAPEVTESVAPADAGALLDSQAKRAYRDRIEDLREDLEQAREWGDPERAASAQEELDALGRELARAVGMSGRDRAAASQAERARQNVGRSIRKAIRRIAADLPELGAHLERAVRTGTYCSYRPQPDPPVQVLQAPPRADAQGTLVLMLTDVEESTRLYAERPDGVELVAQGAAIVAACVASAGGRLVKERGEGDSTFSVFARATDGVACAVDLQRRLARSGVPIRIRVALHAGEVDPRDGDYHGVEVNRCARLRDLAHGGQVLVSTTVAALAGDRLPGGATLRDLGTYRLRGLDRPERVYQIVHPDLLDDFPPPRNAATPTDNLPLQLSSFVGREQERAALTELLGEARLVTLSGAGGAGKTRLAVEVAAELAGGLPGGAWLVDLAPIFESGLVLKAVAQALGVRERPQRDLFDDVIERLRGVELLVVLDNCEHVAEESALLVERLLREAPGVRVLATSREPLGVPGEVVRRMGSLSVPEDGADFEAVAQSEAARLLADRARGVAPGFDLTPTTAPLVARICRRLDGMPLAIELAAARLSALSLHDLAARLDDCFALLTGGARTVLPRQRTLEAAVAWSYDLLSDIQRLLFDRLSVFAGGWTLDAAQQVCATGGLTERDVVDGLSALVDKSLVVREELADGRVRYRQLETLRQYGRIRLGERAEAAQVRDAHLAWVAGMAEQAEVELFGLEQAAWLRRLEAELDNLRAAVEWAIVSGNPEPGIRIVSMAIGGFWIWRGHAAESMLLLERLLEAPGEVRSETRARGLLAAGRIHFQTGRWESGAELTRESRELYRAAGDGVGEARALVWQTMNEWGARRNIRATVDECLEVARRSGGALENALAAGIVSIWWADHDPQRAQELADEAGRLIALAPSPNWLAHISEFRAYVSYVNGDRDGACRLLAEALPLYAQIANRTCGAHCLESAALLATAVGSHEAAGELLGAANALRDELGTSPPAYEAVVRKRGVEAIRLAVGEEGFAAARERGRQLGFEEAIERAAAIAREPAASTRVSRPAP